MEQRQKKLTKSQSIKRNNKMKGNIQKTNRLHNPDYEKRTSV